MAFIKGERVSVYCGELELDGAKATVIGYIPEGLIQVRLDRKTRLTECPTVYPRQLRRLRKGKSREWWLVINKKKDYAVAFPSLERAKSIEMALEEPAEIVRVSEVMK